MIVAYFGWANVEWESSSTHDLFVQGE